MIDGRSSSSGAITNIARLGLEVEGHVEEAPFIVTKLRHYSLLLGISWLQPDNVAIRFFSNTLSFGLRYCLTHCICRPTEITGISTPLPDGPVVKTPIDVKVIGATDFLRPLRKNKRQPIALSFYEIKDFYTGLK